MNRISQNVAILLLVSLLGLVSCDNLGKNGTEPSGDTDLSEAVFTSLSEFDNIQIDGGTFESEFDSQEIYGYEEKVGPARKKYGKKGFRGGKKKDVKREDRRGGLSQLDLSDEQKEQLKAFVIARKECSKSYMEQLREIDNTILEQFNGRRSLLIEDYKAGNLSKDELLDALKSLREEIRTAFENSTERASLIDSMKECKLVFEENIKSILSDEQLAIWETLTTEKG
ncbi:hypothetical protein OAQ99_03700 [Candidatus Kapabacteria bacterium]|nr:hypothetical protein [Candidatus Kapabacteria bacterium]